MTQPVVFKLLFLSVIAFYTQIYTWLKGRFLLPP